SAASSADEATGRAPGAGDASAAASAAAWGSGERAASGLLGAPASRGSGGGGAPGSPGLVPEPAGSTPPSRGAPGGRRAARGAGRRSCDGGGVGVTRGGGRSPSGEPAPRSGSSSESERRMDGVGVAAPGRSTGPAGLGGLCTASAAAAAVTSAVPVGSTGI